MVRKASGKGRRVQAASESVPMPSALHFGGLLRTRRQSGPAPKANRRKMSWLPAASEHPHNRGGDQHAQAERQQHLPTYFHELVKTVARERSPVPDVQVHEYGNFCGEPVDILNTITNRRDKENQSD